MPVGEKDEKFTLIYCGLESFFACITNLLPFITRKLKSYFIKNNNIIIILLFVILLKLCIIYTWGFL